MSNSVCVDWRGKAFGRPGLSEEGGWACRLTGLPLLVFLGRAGYGGMGALSERSWIEAQHVPPGSASGAVECSWAGFAFSRHACTLTAAAAEASERRAVHMVAVFTDSCSVATSAEAPQLLLTAGAVSGPYCCHCRLTVFYLYRLEKSSVKSAGRSSSVCQRDSCDVSAVVLSKSSQLLSRASSNTSVPLRPAPCLDTW